MDSRKLADKLARAFPVPGVPLWTDWLTLDLRQGPVIVTHDFHIPYHSVPWSHQLVRLAVKTNIKRLVIVGDYQDMHSLSPFQDFNVPGAQYEMQIAKEYTLALLAWFDEIVFVLGNHCMRIVKTLSKKFGYEHLSSLWLPDAKEISTGKWNMDLIKKAGECIKFTAYPLVYLTYGGPYDKWMLVHPHLYRQVRLSAARALAEKYLCHIWNTHAHYEASGSDKSGRFFTVDGGGMMDRDKIEYYNMQVTAHPCWNNGIGIIYGDTFEHFTEHTHWPLFSLPPVGEEPCN